MLSDRQKSVLKLIVEEFVRTAEPVGSRTLSKLLVFSPATIRNEMADLEEEGYIEKTHSSSGRVPSEKGYHYYVETLMKEDDTAIDLKIIDDLFKEGPRSRETLIEESMKLLSELTNYTTLALGPQARFATVKKIDLVPLYDNTGLLIVITNQGHLENKQVHMPLGTHIEDAKQVVNILNDLLKDVPISQVSEKLHYEIETKNIEALLNYNESILEAFLEAFTQFTESKFYLSGQSNMLYQPEFSDLDRVRELMKFFEKNEVLKLVEHSDSNGMTVRIGHENQVQAMQDCSVIMVPYDVSSSEKGTIAVVGPTRMEYRKVIPLLKYIASHLSKLSK
jgi:heat-inducible transcriptional repressor